MTRKQTRSGAVSSLLFSLIILLGAFMALPLFYLLIQSVKPPEELFEFPPRFFVNRPTIEYYFGFFAATKNTALPFSRYVFNTLFITLAGLAISIIFSSMAAMPLALYKFPGVKFINYLIILSLLFQAPVLGVPRYILFTKLKIVDTYAALLLPAFASTLGLFLMKNFMTQIPVSMLDSAKIDGAGIFTAYRRIVMPLVRPAWITMILINFQSFWAMDETEFIFSEHLKLLKTAVSQIMNSAPTAYLGVSYALAVMLSLPPIIIFIITQSQVMETMAHAGIKG